MTTTADPAEAERTPDSPLVPAAPARLGHAAERVASSFAGTAEAAKFGVMEPVTLKLLGRRLVELHETAELQTAILTRIDGTLQGIAAEDRALVRRDVCQNRDPDELRERLAALEAKP